VGTPLAATRAVRCLTMILLLTGVAAADPAPKKEPVQKESPKDPPLWSLELRFGKGLEMGGGGAMTTTRAAPLTVSAIVAIAVRAEPWVNAYGGMVAELIDRNAFGAVAGLQMPVRGTPIRVSGGATYMVSPFTLWGAAAAVGGCTQGKFGQLGICGDVEMTAFFAGTDLAEGRTVTQVQVRLGVVFNAF